MTSFVLHVCHLVIIVCFIVLVEKYCSLFTSKFECCVYTVGKMEGSDGLCQALKLFSR